MALYISTDTPPLLTPHPGTQPRRVWGSPPHGSWILYGGTVLVAAVHGAALPDETLERILATEEALGVTNPDCVCRLEHYADQHVDSLRNWLEEEAEAGRTVLGYGAASRAVALFNRAGLFNLPNRAPTQL